MRADDTLVEPIPQPPGRVPIFERAFGAGFSLVIEARPGGTRTDLDPRTFNSNPADPTALPGLLIVVSHPLGDGSSAVCDDNSPAGGVPAVDPPDFSPTQLIANAINDLACRFKDGLGSRRGRIRQNEACTAFDDGGFRFKEAASTVQYCGMINDPLSFPEGDTQVTVRVRDLAGNVSAPEQIIVRLKPLSRSAD